MGTSPGPADRSSLRPWTAAVVQVVVDDLDTDSGPTLDEASTHHLGRVRRLRPGEIVCATDGTGGWRLTSWTGDGRLDPIGAAHRRPAPSSTLSVAFVPVKGDRPELVVQKLTEVGVDRIVVTSSSRSVVRWDGRRAERHMDRLRRVATEAACQCRRLWLPTIETAPLASLADEGFAFGHLDGAEPTSSLRCVVVGPEGGWTDEELAMAIVPPVSLGDHVLRAETAAIAAGVVLTAARRAGPHRALL